MLRALLEAGITPDLVVGSSAGALNAVAFASDPTLRGIQRLEELWTRLRRRDIAGVSVVGLVRALSGRADGLLSAAPLARLLDSSVATRLEETQLPAHVIATDVITGTPIVISRGESIPALLASAAFPGLYAPVSIAGALLVDGGVAADIPVLQAEALGAEVCYLLPAAVNTGRLAATGGPVATACRALSQILDAAGRRDTAAATGTVHILDAPLTEAANPFDFRWTAQLIRDGYTLASDWLHKNHDDAPCSGARARAAA
jgi:NTE family protein